MSGRPGWWGLAAQGDTQAASTPPRSSQGLLKPIARESARPPACARCRFTRKKKTTKPRCHLPKGLGWAQLHFSASARAWLAAAEFIREFSHRLRTNPNPSSKTLNSPAVDSRGHSPTVIIATGRVAATKGSRRRRREARTVLACSTRSCADWLKDNETFISDSGNSSRPLNALPGQCQHASRQHPRKRGSATQGTAAVDSLTRNRPSFLSRAATVRDETAARAVEQRVHRRGKGRNHTAHADIFRRICRSAHRPPTCPGALRLSVMTSFEAPRIPTRRVSPSIA